MSVLSLRRFWPFGAKPTPQPQPEPTPLEKARHFWDFKPTAKNLLAYLSLEPGAIKRSVAVELFMSRCIVDHQGEGAVPYHIYRACIGTHASAVLEAFRLVEPQIRLLMAERPGVLDECLVYNIDAYHAVREHVKKYLPIGRDVEFEFSIERISAIETLFGDQLSKEAAEFTVRFLLSLLGTLPVDHEHWIKEDGRTKLWQRVLEVTKQLLPRTNEPLTAREVALALKDISPSLALKAQRELLA